MLKFTVHSKLIAYEPEDGLSEPVISAIKQKMASVYVNLPISTIKSTSVDEINEKIVLQLNGSNETYRVGWDEISEINGQNITGYTAKQINDLIKTGLLT